MHRLLIVASLFVAVADAQPKRKAGGLAGPGFRPSLGSTFKPATSDTGEAFRLTLASGAPAGTRGQVITVSRAGAKYCPASDSSVSILTNNAPCVANGAVLIEAGTTNKLIQSDAIGGASWGLYNAAYTADQAATPWGTTTMDRITGSGGVSNANAYQEITVTSSTGPFALSAWGRAVSDTHTASVNLACVGSTPATCTCVRDDGTTCTTQTNNADCTGTSSYTTTPARVHLTVTCNAAVTSLYAGFGSGNFYSGSNESHIWGGGMFVQGARYTGSYIPTTATAEGRVADVLTVPTGSTWPTTAGAISATFKPLWGPLGTPNTTATIIGSPFSQGTANGWNPGVDTARKMVSDMRKAGATSAILSSSVQTWTHGTSYAVRFSWDAAGTVTFKKAGFSVSAAGAHADSALPTSIHNPVQIGGSMNGNGTLDGWLSALCVARNPTLGCAQ